MIVRLGERRRRSWLLALLATVLLVASGSLPCSSAQRASSTGLPPPPPEPPASAPSPYKDGPPRAGRTADLLVFSMTLSIYSYRVSEVQSGSEYLIDLRGEVLRLFNFSALSAEAWRVQLAFQSGLSHRTAQFAVSLGPPAGASTDGSRILYRRFVLLTSDRTSGVFGAEQAAYPLLSQIDASRTSMLSYTCADLEQVVTYQQCAEGDARPDAAPSTRNPVAIVVGVAISVSLIALVGCCMHRIARKSGGSSGMSDAAIARRADVEHDIAQQVELEMRAAELEAAGGVHEHAPQPGTAPSPSGPALYHYPGSPNRLADQMPAGVKPIKWGEDDEESQCGGNATSEGHVALQQDEEAAQGQR